VIQNRNSVVAAFRTATVVIPTAEGSSITLVVFPPARSGGQIGNAGAIVTENTIYRSSLSAGDEVERSRKSFHKVAPGPSETPGAGGGDGKTMTRGNQRQGAAEVSDAEAFRASPDQAVITVRPLA
jgi:hypothetical protein